MGTLKHASVGPGLSQAEWEATGTHEIGGVADLNVVRTATKVVAASDALAGSKAMADEVCDGTNDQIEIQAAIDALPT